MKAVPHVSWSSSNPLSFKPQSLTLFMLVFGLSVFGLGEALMIAANFGVSPWVVLAEGVANRVNMSIGLTTFFISLAVLVLWVPLKQMPGLGTIANAIVIALVMDLSLPWLPRPESIGLQALESVTGLLLIGLGSAIYLVAHLGPGPRDGLMTGIQRVTQLPIAKVRTAIEITVVFAGWILGGTVGLGTLMFAFGIGPAVSMSLFWISKLHKSKNASNG
ncbi:MAG: YitT family protein [Pseudohongiellaceae bacterium]